MLDKEHPPKQSVADLTRELLVTGGSPTGLAVCPAAS